MLFLSCECQCVCQTIYNLPRAGDKTRWMIAPYSSINNNGVQYANAQRPITKSSSSANACVFITYSLTGLSAHVSLCRHGRMVVGRRSSYTRLVFVCLLDFLHNAKLKCCHVCSVTGGEEVLLVFLSLSKAPIIS